MELRWATPDDLSTVAAFIARMNVLPEQRCLHCDDDADAVLRNIAALGRPPGESILLAEAEDRLVGLVAADLAVEQERGWVWGPFAEADDPIALADRLTEAFLARVPADIRMLDTFLDQRSIFLAPLAAHRGFGAPRTVHLYRAARPVGGTPAPPAPVTARPEHRAALGPLHEAAFPNTWRTTEVLLDATPESRATFVHERDGLFVGYIHVEADPDDDSAHVHYLAVLPEARGSGVGRLLLEQGLDWCFNARNAAAVSLTVFDGLANARALYESAGFRLVESGVTQRRRIG